MGKPIADVLSVDLPSVIDTIRFMAECIDKIEGSRHEHGSRCDAHGSARAARRRRRHLAVELSAPDGGVEDGARARGRQFRRAEARGAGADELPASSRSCSCEAGGPPGVFNVVNGLGEVAGKALALHPDVAKITFTGSTEVGKLILQYAGQSNMKQVALECGGKSPQVFAADVADLDRAVTAAYRGIYSNMGEVCNAGSRLLVDRAIYDRFVERFIELGKDAYRPGDPLDPATTSGPLVTREAQQRVLGLIEAGKARRCATSSSAAKCPKEWMPAPTCLPRSLPACATT